MRIIYDTTNYGVTTGKFNASTNYKNASLNTNNVFDGLKSL